MVSDAMVSHDHYDEHQQTALRQVSYTKEPHTTLKKVIIKTRTAFAEHPSLARRTPHLSLLSTIGMTLKI